MLFNEEGYQSACLVVEFYSLFNAMTYRPGIMTYILFCLRNSAAKYKRKRKLHRQVESDCCENEERARSCEVTASIYSRRKQPVPGPSGPTQCVATGTYYDVADFNGTYYDVADFKPQVDILTRFLLRFYSTVKYLECVKIQVIPGRVWSEQDYST